MEKVRYDKSWFDCMTVSEMTTLREQSEGKLTNKHMEMDEEDEGGGESLEGGNGKRKRRKGAAGTGGSRAKQATLSSVYRSIDTSNIMVETHDLKFKTIVIEPANAALKAELEAVVVKHGGTIEQNCNYGKTYAYVETGFKVKAKNVAKSKKVDVVRSGWLLDCKTKFRPFR